MKKMTVIGAVVASAALSIAAAGTASAYAPILSGNTELVLFGSGTHVSSATVHSIPDLQGPAEYEFIYSATTSPTKTFTMICGGSSTGGSCSHKFSVNATYAKGIGIKSCGQIKRVSSGQTYGTPCKKW